jgi:hypothetical protein
MQSNTVEVENQAVNFPNFSVEKKTYKSDPFRIRDGHYIGSDRLSSQVTSRSSTSGFPITSANGSVNTRTGRHRRRIWRTGRKTC